MQPASGGCGAFPSLLALDWNRDWSCSVTVHGTAKASLCVARVVLSLHLLESLLPTTQTFSGVVFSLFMLSVSPRLPFYLKCPHFTGPLKTSPARLLSPLKILLVLTSTYTGAKVPVAVAAHPSEDSSPSAVGTSSSPAPSQAGTNGALCQKQDGISKVITWISCCVVSLQHLCMDLFILLGISDDLLSHSKHSGSAC